MHNNSVLRRNINSLTSIRSLAAMGIVLFHIKYTMPRFFAHSCFDTFQLCFVALFFVQSGFVLSYRHSDQKKLDPKEFYLRRYSRIYPLHVLTFIVWCFLFLSSWGLTMNEEILIGIANLTLTQTLFPGLKFSLGYNAVSWFLADIAFCYILFPLLRNFKAAFSLVSLVVIYLSIQIIFHLDQPINDFFPNFNFFFPLVHISEFCVGILAAHFFRIQKKLKFATFWEFLIVVPIIAALSFAVLNYSLPVMQLYYLFIIPLFTYIFACEQGAISNYMANQKALIFLGNASFSIYMWHHLIMFFLGNTLSIQTPPLLAVTGAIFIALTTATMSYKYFELPVRESIIRRLSKRR
jgi:peptidoglycan/LPS O-acetylase OafA/YrhL